MPAIPNPYHHRITVPTPPAQVPAYDEQPTYRFVMTALRWVLSLLALLILGAALYPGGEPSRPLRLADEAPASRTAWHESDYSH